jgi:rRNA maturation endonuclease Nob1
MKIASCRRCGKEFEVRQNNISCPECRRKYGTTFHYLISLSSNERLCYFCERNISLEVHHIDRDRKNDSFNNYLLMCRRCHRKLHKIYAKVIRAEKEKK